MTDVLSQQQRSRAMSKVRGADTMPEWILRRALHRLGFRYTLGNKHLPGRPDLVFPRFHVVVFIHGCFWHHHAHCKRAAIPRGNRDFWMAKFSENARRDERVAEELKMSGWKVVTVWECQLLDTTLETVETVARALREDFHRQTSAARSRDDVMPALDRAELLRVAERKVRYRINGYGNDRS